MAQVTRYRKAQPAQATMTPLGLTTDAATSFAKLKDVFMLDISEPLQMEILPKALHGTGHDLLRDGNDIGVPKPLLLEAYLEARSVVIDIPSDTDKMVDEVSILMCRHEMSLYSSTDQV